MVSPDPLRSTGFNGSVLNLLPQIGITSLVFGKYHWNPPDVKPSVGNLPRLPGRPFGVATAPDLTTTH